MDEATAWFYFITSTMWLVKKTCAAYPKESLPEQLDEEAHEGSLAEK